MSICAASRAINLNLTKHLDFHIRRFRRFAARHGCPSDVISDVGRNSVLDEMQMFVHSLGVDWRMNLPLAPWYDRFFERPVCNTNVLLRKVLQIVF